jgi:hypothetical protein
MIFYIAVYRPARKREAQREALLGLLLALPRPPEKRDAHRAPRLVPVCVCHVCSAAARTTYYSRTHSVGH